MVSHKHTYSLGHIPTAKYWHNVVEDGIHHTSADTGWGKAVWGNLYGQWIAGTGVFIYDYERFNGLKLLEKIIEYKGEYTAMREARHHAGYYTKGMHGGAALRREICTYEHFEQLQELAWRICKENE
jgi:hypothetical protein